MTKKNKANAHTTALALTSEASWDAALPDVIRRGCLPALICLLHGLPESFAFPLAHFD
jgi:hypothetical protein